MEIEFLRLPQVLKIIPISKSKWWAGIKKGEYPAGCKLGPRTTAWRKSDITKLAQKFSEGSSSKPEKDDSSIGDN